MTPRENSMEKAGSAHEAMSLFELNTIIRCAVDEALPESYWVRAEMSDVRVNSSSGHCYLEFIEKDEKTGQIIAKARGTIWMRTFRIIKPYFEKETGQLFVSGLKALVKVSVEFHELYGYSLNVGDIDPSYTLGDMLRKRKEIIRRLQEEGIFDLNRELPLPLLLRRIAVITSPTAAGYGDFIHQLEGNQYSIPFYIKLFAATMQGEKTAESVIAALDRIFPHADLFDAVVIIRGGGSTSELSSFDSYPLAACIAQFPLPLITGIGHERDDTVVDMVAHTRLKTPTAVAAFLIESMVREAAQLHALEQIICEKVNGHIERHRKQLHTLTAFMSSLPQWIRHRTEKLDEIPSRLLRATDTVISRQSTTLAAISVNLRRACEKLYAERRQKLDLSEQYIKMVSPEYVLKRGYTLTFKNQRIVKQSIGLAAGDNITIKFADGEKQALVVSHHLKTEN